MIDNKDSVRLSEHCFDVCEKVQKTIHGTNASDLGELEKMVLEDLERYVDQSWLLAVPNDFGRNMREIERTLMEVADLPHTKYNRGKVESHMLKIQQAVGILYPSSLSLGDGPSAGKRASHLTYADSHKVESDDWGSSNDSPPFKTGMTGTMVERNVPIGLGWNHATDRSLEVPSSIESTGGFQEGHGFGPNLRSLGVKLRASSPSDVPSPPAPQFFFNPHNFSANHTHVPVPAWDVAPPTISATPPQPCLSSNEPLRSSKSYAPHTQSVAAPPNPGGGTGTDRLIARPSAFVPRRIVIKNQKGEVVDLDALRRKYAPAPPIIKDDTLLAPRTHQKRRSVVRMETVEAKERRLEWEKEAKKAEEGEEKGGGGEGEERTGSQGNLDSERARRKRRRGRNRSRQVGENVFG